MKWKTRQRGEGTGRAHGHTCVCPSCKPWLHEVGCVCLSLPTAGRACGGVPERSELRPAEYKAISGYRTGELIESLLSRADREPAAPLKPARRTGKAIGYRGWTLDGYRLGSANALQHGGHWEIGPNRAVCRIAQRAAYLEGIGQTIDPSRLPPHDAPHPECECGLYAYFAVGRGPTMHFAPGDRLVVWGAVAAWGRLHVHCDGFRAEYAEPVALGYDPRGPYEDVVRMQAVAGELGLPFVTLGELPAEAAKRGEEVPMDLRPAAASYLDLLGGAGGTLVEAMNRLGAAAELNKLQWREYARWVSIGPSKYGY